LSSRTLFLPFFKQLFRAYDHDSRFVTAEVFTIEGEDLGHAVSFHRGHVKGVMGVFPGDLVSGDYALPVLVHGGRVRDEGRKLLKVLEVLGGVARA